MTTVKPQLLAAISGALAAYLADEAAGGFRRPQGPDNF
jgi:hypothetical protein